MSLGLGRDFVIETPLMHLTKAQSWMLAENLGGKALVDLTKATARTAMTGATGAVSVRPAVCGLRAGKNLSAAAGNKDRKLTENH